MARDRCLVTVLPQLLANVLKRSSEPRSVLLGEVREAVDLTHGSLLNKLKPTSSRGILSSIMHDWELLSTGRLRVHQVEIPLLGPYPRQTL